MSFHKKLQNRFRVPLPGGTIGKYGTFGKTGTAWALSPYLGPMNPLSVDPDVLGARGSSKMLGRSVDRAEDKKVGDALAVELQQQKAAAAGGGGGGEAL